MAGRPQSENRDLAAVALAAGKTVGEAATAAEVVERTVYGWNTDPEFRARVSELRREMVNRVSGELADAMSAAARKLRGLIDSPSDGIALRAASAVIDQTLKVTELVELQCRVEQLEQDVARLEREKPTRRPNGASTSDEST
jgi:hypothetical protein